MKKAGGRAEWQLGMAGVEAKMASEGELGRKWDRCLADSAVKLGKSWGAGVTGDRGRGVRGAGYGVVNVGAEGQFEGNGAKTFGAGLVGRRRGGFLEWWKGASWEKRGVMKAWGSGEGAISLSVLYKSSPYIPPIMVLRD